MEALQPIDLTVSKRDKILAILRYFDLSEEQLENCLSISHTTMQRWLAKTNQPNGLHLAVIEALYAITIERNIDKQKAIERVKLGIGSVIFYNLMSVCKYEA